MPTITFQPDAEDLVASYRACFARSLRRPKFWWQALAGAIIVPAMAFVISWGDRLKVQLSLAAGMLLLWIVLMAVLVGIRWLLLPRWSRRIFAQQRTLHEPVTLDWSADGIQITSGRGGARFAWSDFHARYEGRAIILLMQSEALFNFIPKRALTPAQVAEIMGAR